MWSLIVSKDIRLTFVAPKFMTCSKFEYNKTFCIFLISKYFFVFLKIMLLCHKSENSNCPFKTSEFILTDSKSAQSQFSIETLEGVK